MHGTQRPALRLITVSWSERVAAKGNVLNLTSNCLQVYFSYSIVPYIFNGSQRFAWRSQYLMLVRTGLVAENLELVWIQLSASN